MQFHLVYIREAHALDSPSPMGGGDAPLVEDPETLLEREKLAGTCVEDLGLDMIPAVLDRMDDRVNRDYGAWPDRLYLVGRDGIIRYKGGRGPFGFKPDELELAIRAELAVGGDDDEDDGERPQGDRDF